MVYVLLGTGFEETEAIVPVDLLRRAGIPVMTVGINGKTVYGGHNIGIEADILLDEMDLSNMDMIVLPGGLGGVASIRGNKQAMDAVRYAWKNGKYTAAICAAPTITDGKQATCYPGCEADMGSAKISQVACIKDGNLITGASAGCAVPFGLALIRVLKGQQTADKVAQQIVIR